MRWILEDADGLTYDLNGNFKAARVVNLDFTKDFEEIKRSYNSGSIVTGIKRLEAKDITIDISYDQDDELTHRTKLNQLFSFLDKVVSIKEETYNLRTYVTAKDFGSSFDEGSYLKGGTIPVSLLQLTPYWESTIKTEATDSGSDIEIEMTNNGALFTPIYITLTTALLNTEFSIWVSETKKGIEVQDLSFGELVNDLTTYEIDNTNGVIYLGNSTDIKIPRNDRIKAGTGFFEVPSGDFKLNIAALESVDADVYFYERYYI